MGEIPIFTSNAHVFTIDPVTKKSWLPSSKSLVQVNFFFDSARNSYRIISVEGSKTIINSTLTPNMNFTKTSAKFGQWADIRAGIVYGVGFGSDLYLSKFAEQFEIIRDKAKSNEMDSNDNAGVLNHEPNQNESEPACENGSASSTSNNIDDPLVLVDAVKKLTMKNEALKQSFHQNTSELKRHKSELDGLKATNKKLTSTLQETMASGNEMHQKLIRLSEENESLHMKVKELENGKVLMEKSVEDLKTESESLHKRSSEMSQECNLLQQRIGVLSVVEAQHNECASRIKSLMDENQQLHEEKRVLEEKIVGSSDKRRSDVAEVRKCCATIANHLTYITEATQKLQKNTM